MPPDPMSLSNGSLLSMPTQAVASSGLASSLLGGKTTGALFVDMISGSTVQNDIISHFHLKEVYKSRYNEAARLKLASNTSIVEDKRSGTISISVIDTDRYRARDIAAMYVQELNSLVVALNNSSAHREREFLEGRLAKVKQDLDHLYTQMSFFSSRNLLVNPEAQGRSLIESEARLRMQLLSAENQKQELSTIYTANSPEMSASEALITSLRSQLTDLHKNIAGSDPDLEKSSTTSKYLPSMLSSPTLAVDYQSLFRQARILETVYSTLSTQYELARVQEVRELPSVKVLDKPEIAEKKTAPACAFLILFGMLLFLLGGIGRVAWEFWWSHTNDAGMRSLLQTISSDLRGSSIGRLFSARHE